MFTQKDLRGFDVSCEETSLLSTDPEWELRLKIKADAII